MTETAAVDPLGRIAVVASPMQRKYGGRVDVFVSWVEHKACAFQIGTVIERSCFGGTGELIIGADVGARHADFFLKVGWHSSPLFRRLIAAALKHAHNHTSYCDAAVPEIDRCTAGAIRMRRRGTAVTVSADCRPT